MSSATPACRLSRRHGLALMCGALAAPAVFAQTPDAPAGPDARLINNLLTRIGVAVEIGDRRPVFVIDTGAERTSISDTLARDLGLSPGPDVMVHGITAAERTATAILPRLDLLNRPFHDLVTPVFARDLLAADGFLGLDVLSRFRLLLDFRNRRASLSVSGQRPLYEGVGVRSPSRIHAPRGARQTGSGQLLLSSVRIGDTILDAFIDSGAQYSVGNRRMAALAGPSEGDVALYGVVGQSLTAQKRTVRELRIARRRFEATPLLFADLHAFGVLGLSDRPALLLGADLLTRFRSILLDYGEGRIALNG